MALFKKNKKEEETGPASSSRIADAVRNIFNATVAGQQKAVQADQAVARETNRQVMTAARNLIDATTRGQQAATRADQAVAGAQNQRLADAAAGLYSAYQQQQERAARDQMARQSTQMQAPTTRAQDAAAGLYSAYLQQQESLADIQRRQNQSQADTMASLYANAADSLRGANELYMRQLDPSYHGGTRAPAKLGTLDVNPASRGRVQNPDGTYSTVDTFSREEDGKEVLVPTVINVNGRWVHVDEDTAWRHYQRTGEHFGKFNTPEEADAYARQLHEYHEDYYANGENVGARANELMTQPVLERANQRQSSLVSGDPKKGAGKYLKYMNAADFAVNSQAREDNKDATYNYINGLNGERERQQGYAFQRGADSGMEKYLLMTAEERGVYNYLYNTQGKTAANGFLARLDPELNEQYFSGQSKYQTELANQDAGSRLAFSAATVAQQPARTLGSAAALVEDVIRADSGEGIDPYSEFRRASMLAQDVRGSIAEYYDQQYPGGFLGMTAGDVYNTVMSAADSAMNMAVAGYAGQAAGAIRGLDNIDKVMSFTNQLGSAMMSSEVAATAIAESKKKGYSDVGALSLGIIRGGIEYLSEKIGGDWIISRMKKNPLNAFKTIAMAMIPEGVEEVMSDIGNEIVNMLVDDAYGTDESYVLQAHKQFEQQGSENPWADTLGVILKQEWKSFAGGALSALGSGGTFYVQNRGAINQAANQLNTDAKTVVQLMDELETENPDEVRLLAELFDVKSADEMRGKIRELTDAEAAIDQRMQEQEAEETAPTERAEEAARAMKENENAPTEGRGAVTDVDTEGVFDNGEQSDNRRRQNRDDAFGTGGADLLNEAGAQRSGMDARDESRQRRDRIQNYGVKEEVTPAQLGIANGSTTQRVQVLDESSFEPGSPEAMAIQSAREAGLDPVIIRGTMDIGGKQARAFIFGNRVILQADAGVSADKLLKHEQYHREARRNPQLNDTLRRTVAERMTEQQMTDLVSRYITAYDGVYDFSQMTQEEIEHICEEELFADLYAGIDNSGRTDLREAAQQGFDEAQSNEQNVEANRDTTGPPENEYAYPKDEDALYTQERLYSYDFLTHQDPMQRLDLPDVNSIRNLTPEQVAAEGMKDIAKIGTVVETQNNGQVGFVKNKYTEHYLQISKGTIRHSMNRNAGALILNKQLGSIIGQAAQNAIPINGLANENRQAAGTYAMAGYARDNKGHEYIALLTVEHYTGEVLDAEVLDVQHAIAGRINKNQMTPVATKAQDSNEAKGNDLSLNTSSDNITIAELLDIVNKTHRGLLSKDVLGHFGEERPKDGYYSGRTLFSVDVPVRSDEEYEEDRKRALEYFGTTYNANEAGYITTDGRYLDFSGKRDGARGGSRTVDHRDIGDAFDGDYGDGTYSGAMVEFMRGGNIRVSPESGGINLMGKPTKQQADKLQQFIQKYRGEVVLDVDDKNGNTLFSIEYPKYTNSNMIIREINDYYDKGRRPEQFDNSRFSVEVPGDIRRQLADAEREYMEHSDANDAEYDYRAQLEKINDLRRQIEEAESVNAEDDNVNAETDTNPTIEALEREGRVSRGTYDVEKYGDTHPERGEVGRDGVRMCNTIEDLEAELNEIGGARIRNDTGEYFARIRRKNDNGFLLTINRDGKRDTSRSFADYKEASAYAASYIEGQTQARTDAELDNEKSAPVPRQEPIEAAVTGSVQDEAKRQKQNKAAEASTQSLRDRIRKTDEEIKALRRLEKTTGLTELQAQHKADLQETLEILNDELTSRKGRAKAKKEKVEVKGNKPVRSAAEAKNRLMEIFHTAAGQKADTGTKLEAKLAEIVSSGKITEQNREDILDMLIDAGMVRQEAEQEYRDVRDWLRGSRIYVSEHDRADFGDDWEGIRKSAWANGIYLTSNENDRSVDSLVSELAETFGTNMFPTDDAPSDMVRNLIEQAEKGRSSMITFAEAVNNEARMEHVDPQEIWNDLSRQADETLTAFAEKAKLEMDLKDRTASMLATERKRAEDRMERMAQRRRESEIREKTFKAIRRLKKLRGKAAADVKTQIDEAIRDIDTQARQLTINGLEDLQELARVYEDAKKAAGYVDEENPGNFLKNPDIEDRLNRLTQKHINEMDIDDVIELGRVVAALENTVKTNGKMIGEQFDSEVKTVADKVNAEVQSSRGAGVSGLKGFAQKWFKEEQLAPRRFLEMLGGWKKGAVANLADSLEKGQTRMLDFQRRAMQSMDPFMDKYKKWVKTASGKNAKWYTYSVANGMAMDGSGVTGQSIEITPMMKVSLYLMSLNEDNLRHIQTGGLRIPDKALYLKGKTQEAFAQGQQVKMQPQAVRAIASTLTQEEKTFAQYLQKFFDSQSKDAINEVSVQLDGFERADVENYFPIESYSSYIKSDVSGEARAATVEGIGSIANERVHAGNPIKLDDAYNVWMRQVEKVSRYYGYAIPIRNFQAVNNYVFHEEGNAFAGSIKDTINRKWGTGAENYITKMLKDIQSGSQRNGDLMSSGMAKMRSNLAGATLTLNAKVAMTQAASYPGAAQAVGWDGLAAGLVSGPVDEKLIEKYTPLLWYRSQGYSTQEIGDAMSAQNKTLPQKALRVKLLNWIQGVDILTVRRLWKAAEYRVTKDTGLKPGSKALIDSGMDPYYQKVAEVFNRAVYDTQPNYTEMERAQILRSDSDVTKFFTMYKTVPLQYYGMMTEAVGRLQAAQKSGNKAEIATARRYAANTFAGLIAANAVYSAIGKAMKGFLYGKKDDEDEESAANDLKQLGIDTAETFAGSVIGGAELWSLMESALTGKKWNAPQMNILTAVEDIWTNMQSVFKAWDSEDPQKIAKAVRETAKNVSSAVGIPLKNIENLALAITRWRSPEAAMQYDAMFGGIDKTSLKTMDPNIIGSAASIIMNSRTGVNMERAATDELSRLYAAGYTEAIPTAIKDSFEYGGNEIKIKDKRKYSETWGGVVGDNLEELTTSESYINADDKTKEAMIRRLYQYATVQARYGADPEYTVEGSSTYGWTEKADAAMESGMDLPTVIAAMTTMNAMTADKVNGQTVKTLKSKRVEYIDGLKLDTEQKDALYELAGYESGLEKAPWHSGISAEAGYATGTNKPVINEAARKRAVEANYQQLTSSAAYKAADDQTKKAMIEKLNQYAEVQGMVTTDPDYLPTGTAGWTIWAETAEKAGIDLISAIDYATQLDSFKADYNEYGKAISGSKKDKVTKYIDALDLTNEQKDILYLKIYAENSLKYTPWHGYTGKKKKRRGGGRRGSGKKSTAAKKPVSVGKITPKYDSGIDISTLFPTTTSKKSGSGLSSDLAKIVSSGLDISELFKLPTTGTKAPKGRTTVDFKL